MEKKNTKDLYEEFEGCSRFDYPDYMVRVTSGFGGESILVFSDERAALYDTGMAYCHKGTIENIRKALSDHGQTRLDCVLMSHTHYDHIGALPYILREWPDVVVVGSAKAKAVFASQGAKATMKRLGEAARDCYVEDREPVLTDGFRIDKVVGDGDIIEMGSRSFEVIETKGHTDCSLTYVLRPESVMFASESTGVLRAPDRIHTAILKSYKDSMDSAKRCRAYGAKRIIIPHYGLIPAYYNDRYFEMYFRAAEDEKKFILSCRDEGMNRDEILKAFDDKYWTEERGRAQPRAAFLENAKYSVNHILNNF